MECGPSTFQSVQGLKSNSGLTGIAAKFGTKYRPNFLGNWGGDICIEDITHFDLEVIQDRH